MIDTQAIRNKILDLAMRGQLTEQLPEDGTAAELYQQIQAEKQRLFKEGKIKKDNPLPEISKDEISFEIPNNWKWVRLGKIVQQITDGTHKTPTYQETGIPFLSVKNISGGFLDMSDIKFISTDEHNELIKRCKPEKDDILICRIGTLGKAIRIDTDVDFSIFVSLGLVKTGNRILSDYIVSAINSGYGSGWIQSVKAGGAMHAYKINLSDLNRFLFPLPPLDEQKRIIERITELFSILDTIDELQTQYADDLTALKSKLIDGAIQGKLTEQLPEDGTAEELYQQIQAEKQRLISEGKIKKEKPLTEISEEEIPFDIPDNWKWVRWGDLSYQIQYGYNAPAKDKGRIRMVRITDIQGNKVIWDNVPYCDIDEDCIEVYKLKPNNILFARTGGTVGKSYLVENVDEEAVFAGYLIRTSFSGLLSAKYMKYFMDSHLYWKQLQNGTTAFAQPNCNAKTLSKMMLPLPPLAEQKRIVQKLEEILPLCE